MKLKETRHTTSFTKQIIFVSICVILAFTSLLWFSVLSLKSAMDEKGSELALSLLAGRIGTLQDQVSIIASDYHNWTDIYIASEQDDHVTLSTNYGISAARGDVFQYAQIIGGRLSSPLAWVSGKGLSPQSGFLEPGIVSKIAYVAPTLNVIERQTFDFFGVISDEIVMFSSSLLLPEDPELMKSVNLEEAPIAVIGRILSRASLKAIEYELGINNLTTSFDQPHRKSDQLALADVAGEPIAYLSWSPPMPGTNLLGKTAPILAGATFAFTSLTLVAARLLILKGSELLRRKAEAATAARTDPLTGLPNRLALLESIKEVPISSGDRFAAIALDLDRFKRINDVVGHAGGDEFLRSFGVLLASARCDYAEIFRHGGDEFFIVIYPHDTFEETINNLILLLTEIFQKQIQVDGFDFEVSASKGLAYSRNSDVSSEDTLNRADKAMYQAKKLGTHEVLPYSESMEKADENNKRLEIELRSALETGEQFSVMYQPLVSAEDTDRVVGLEALARWENYQLGVVPPEEFIRVAESTGLIIPLGWRLLDIICRDLRLDPSIRVSINVSPLQLMTPALATEMVGRIKNYGIECDRFQIEITENVAIIDNDSLSSQLKYLQSEGFTIALDDFGTGYSSIGYLSSIPFDVVKIDKSIVAGQNCNGSDNHLVQSIVDLAHALKMKVVAEGIENCHVAEKLELLNCDFLQGFYFGKPAPFQKIILGSSRRSC